MSITILHNPSCSTSRNALALIRHAGFEPQVIEYLKQPLNAGELRALLTELQLSARDILRQKGALYDELGLHDQGLSDEAILQQIAAHPALMERPIVRSPWGVVLARPVEAVLAILPVAQLEPFTKENGAQVIDDGQRRHPKV